VNDQDQPAPLADLPVLEIAGVEVYREGNCLCWVSGLSVDADGCPTAYAPIGSGLAPRDDLRNAGRPGRWVGLVTHNGKRDGDPVIQGPNDPAPGFYVSPTSYGDHSRPETDQRRYVDAARVPYIAIPPEVRALGVQMGDVALVEYRGFRCDAVVAEGGPAGKIGEGSIFLAATLGMNSSPKNGGVGHGVTYRIFLGTSRPWPRMNDSITAQVAALLAAG
jgi:hypothetical protein